MSTVRILHTIEVLNSEPEAVETVIAVPEAVTIAPEVEPEPEPDERRYVQPSRQNTASITIHLPRHVRQQLRILAAHEDRQLQDMMSEALNLLFRAYGRPEIAPRFGDVDDPS